MATVEEPVLHSYDVRTATISKFWGSTNSETTDEVKYTVNGNQFINTRMTEDSVGWKDRIKRGLNATGTLIGTKLEVDYSPGSAFLEYTYDYGFDLHQSLRQEYSGPLRSPDIRYPQSSDLPVSVINGAAEQYYKRARKAQTTLQSLVVLGELGKTVRMILNSGRQLQSGLFAYLQDVAAAKRRRRKSWGRDGSRIVSDLWLTFSFGVKPLLSDIDNGARALAEDRTFLSDKVFIKTSSSAGESGLVGVSQQNVAGLNVYSDLLAKEVWDCTFYGVVARALPYNANYNQFVLGYDWSNFAPAVWELIPYSFLVDYFTNVGEIVSAASFNQATCKWQSRTLRCESSVSVCNVFADQPSDNPPFQELSGHNLSPGTYAIRVKTVDRRALDSVPVPSLDFQIPNSSTKWINMAALAASRDRIVAR